MAKEDNGRASKYLQQLEVLQASGLFVSFPLKWDDHRLEDPEVTQEFPCQRARGKYRRSRRRPCAAGMPPVHRGPNEHLTACGIQHASLP